METSNIVKTESSVGLVSRESIGLLEILKIFDSYKFKANNYRGIVKGYLAWLVGNGLPIADFSKNTYLAFLQKDRNLKRINSYKTPLNKLLQIAKENEFLGSIVKDDRDKKTFIETRLEAYFEAFLSLEEKGLGKRTKIAYRQYFKAFAKYCDAKDLHNFSDMTVKKYRAYLTERLRNGDITSFSINARLSALREFARFLNNISDELFADKTLLDKMKYERDLVRITQIRDAKINKRKKVYKASLTKEQINRVLQNAKNSKERLAIALMYFVGLRIEETVQLKHSDIDFKSKQISVISKGMQRDTIDIGFCSKELKLYYDAFLKTYKPNLDKRIFHTINTQHTIRSFVNKNLKELNLKKIKNLPVTCHSLRHSIIQHLILAGVDVVAVNKFARHNDISTTQRYFRLLQMENKIKISENAISFDEFINV